MRYICFKSSHIRQLPESYQAVCRIAQLCSQKAFSSVLLLSSLQRKFSGIVTKWYEMKIVLNYKTQERRYFEPSKQVLVFQILSVANCFKPLCDNSGRCFCKNAEMATGKTNIQILGKIYVFQGRRKV